MLRAKPLEPNIIKKSYGSEYMDFHIKVSSHRWIIKYKLKQRKSEVSMEIVLYKRS